LGGVSKFELLGKDRDAFKSLPSTHMDIRRIKLAKATSQSLVRFDRNDYSVPTAYAFHELTALGSMETVNICFGGKTIASHNRSWGRGQVVYEPVHYLGVLERKPGALDFAAPLADWQLPVCFGILRRRLESLLGHAGRREYIKILRFMESYSVAELSAAVQKALEIGTDDVDAVRLILQNRREKPIKLFTLNGHPHLQGVSVPMPDLHSYGSLLVKGGAA